MKNTEVNHHLFISAAEVDRNTASLIGFALKSRQAVKGFEGVSRAAASGDLDIILFRPELSENTRKKIMQATSGLKVLLVETRTNSDWKELWGIPQRIMGIRKGELGKSITRNFKSGE
ncbi:MAG: hypothetical protein WAN36_07665 [Calditrichia bacterium]